MSEKLTESAILREYYADTAYITTPEGIMKVLAVLGCLAAAVLFLAGGGCAGAGWLAAGGGCAGAGWLAAGGGCAGAGWLAAGGAALALGGGAALALQLAGGPLGAPQLAPHAWFYADVVCGAALAALLVLGGVLSLTLCELRGRIAYVHAPLALAVALLAGGSAARAHREVTRRWDAARGPAREPRRAPPADIDV